MSLDNVKLSIKNLDLFYGDNQALKNINIDIEVFVHGALCISYSGQCLFSSMVGGRSGNRGKCAQPCRLPYELLENDIDYNVVKEFDKWYKKLSVKEQDDSLYLKIKQKLYQKGYTKEEIKNTEY